MYVMRIYPDEEGREWVDEICDGVGEGGDPWGWGAAGARDDGEEAEGLFD